MGEILEHEMVAARVPIVRRVPRSSSPPWARTVRDGWWYLPLIHVGLPSLAWWADGLMRIAVPRPLRRAGQLLALLGGGLTGWSLWTVVRQGEGTPLPHDPPRRLICRGPYRYCRNPMELGNLLTLLGRAIASGRLRLLVASLVFAAATQLWIVRVEEPYLLRHFGAQYAAYRRAVPRWGWRLRPFRLPSLAREPIAQ